MFLDDGLNEVKLKNYGQKFVDCVNQYLDTNPTLQSTKPENPNLSGSSSSDKLTGLSKNSSNSNTDVNNIKQFAFVENKLKLSAHSSQNSTSQNNEPVDFDGNTNSDISDSQFNEIMDFLENDPDATICEANSANENKSSNDSNDDFQISSLSKNKKAIDLIDENSLELNAELLKISDSENNEKVKNDSQDKKRKLSSAEDEIEIIPKKTTKIWNKFLDF